MQPGNAGTGWQLAARSARLVIHSTAGSRSSRHADEGWATTSKAEGRNDGGEEERADAVPLVQVCLRSRGRREGRDNGRVPERERDGG